MSSSVVPGASAPFDSVAPGTVVTADHVLPNAYVAIHGETIAAIGEDALVAVHGGARARRMRTRVAATYLRGRLVWDRARLLARPGDGRFVPRAGV